MNKTCQQDNRTCKTKYHKEMTSMGIYIYGVVPNFFGKEMYRSLEKSGVYAITCKNISGFVSISDSKAIDYSDRESLGYLVVHHQQIIEELQSIGFSILIPFKLGTIVDSEEDVVKILSAGYDLIIETFKKTQFYTEIDLAITWADFSGTLKDIAGDPKDSQVNEAIINNDDKLGNDDHFIAWGLIKSKLKDLNTKMELNILEYLSPISLDIKPHDVMNYQMISNSAFLINRSDQKEFEQLVRNLDKDYKGKLNFKIVGPLPCYSFFTIEIEELNPENVFQANIELGLKEETSEQAIKKAYLKKAKLFPPDVNLKKGEEEYFNSITKAYHILLDYSAVARQSLKTDKNSPMNEKIHDNLILVKIKR
jgi:hypothetical protein